MKIRENLLREFKNGENFKSYEILGAVKEKKGFSFSVWAPKAKSVSVVGDFNGWDKEKNKMELLNEWGIWHTYVENAKEGQCYKFLIEDSHKKETYKADPYARYSQLRPETASVLYESKFNWSDGEWIENRKKSDLQKPMLIYEVHLGSWKTKEDGSPLPYREMADKLTEYVKEMGYTHIELMPVTEYPFDGSWGYQVTGYFAPTSRYGTPDDFMYFVNKCHESGIGVIMDWVPAHFPRDEHGLAFFDGGALYEYADWRKGEHKEWGTLVFDYGRGEVISFLISSAFYWLSEYHIDGIRVDAVSSMLYLDYGRSEWIPNIYGGKENLEAIAFLRKLNTKIKENFNGVIMIAEESTAWPSVTKSAQDGGLGFDLKWNMGWMNDSLRYMSMDPYFRKYNHNLLTFSMVYAFSENFVLPISHDEVVHGKASLIQKMAGLYGQKFDSLKTFFMFKMAHPGKKMMFMGCEIAQFIEWRYNESLEWNLLEFETHRTFFEFIKKINRFYRENKALWEIDNHWDGFEWINPDDNERSIVSFVRRGKNVRDEIVVICNFTPVEYKNYIVGVPRGGCYSEVLSTDDKAFGGKGRKVKSVYAKKKPFNNMPHTISVDLPPMSGVYLKRTGLKKSEGKRKNEKN